jgi:hypothetical protein
MNSFLYFNLSVSNDGDCCSSASKVFHPLQDEGMKALFARSVQQNGGIITGKRWMLIEVF